MLAILATCETEIRRIIVPSQPWANSSQDPILKKKKKKKTGLTEWFKWWSACLASLGSLASMRP
jgi:hypothetical protein